MTITLIAMMDMNNGISDSNEDLLYEIPKDMQHFKNETEGKIVVMGRKTWDTLPTRPLPNRKNIVLTKDENFEADGAEVFHSITDMIRKNMKEDFVVIGGGEIYKQFLPYANKMILTHVHDVHNDVKTYFPDYEFKDWVIDSMDKYDEVKNQHPSFTIAKYTRKRG